MPNKPTVPRIDPPSRPTDGSVSSAIKNADPNRHYVLANPNDVYYGVPHMLDLGYEIETKRPGGPSFLGVTAISDGSAITREGQVLMSCPVEQELARQEEGRKRIDALANRIKQHGDPDGPQRGPTGQNAYWVSDPSEQSVRS